MKSRSYKENATSETVAALISAIAFKPERCNQRAVLCSNWHSATVAFSSELHY